MGRLLGRPFSPKCKILVSGESELIIQAEVMGTLLRPLISELMRHVPRWHLGDIGDAGPTTVIPASHKV